MQAYQITVADRALFKQCRRAWDLGAHARRALEPVVPARPPALVEAVVAALAVYYFPGMWQWPRTIVVPLVHQALDRAIDDGYGAGASDRRAGHDLIDDYASWAPAQDTFIPFEVAADIEVNIPDPVLSDRCLANATGDLVRFVTRLDALVFGDDHRPWLLCHRVTFDPFGDPALLALDEAALADCWAWREYSLDARVAGVVFNEVRLGGGPNFRRSRVPLSSTEFSLVGRQLALEAFDMLDAGLALYPNPTPHNCGRCLFRAPCRVIQEGADPEPLLSTGYRRRPARPLEEGRLGGRTWSMSRGARPPEFGSRR